MREANRWVFGCGICTLILGSATLIFQTTIFSYVIELIMRLNENTHVFDAWQTIPVDLPTTFYFFNWTNHEDFPKGAKPKFEEIGPYRFLEKFQKVNVIHNDNDTLTYKQIKSFRYDDNFENNGNTTDKFITINYFTMFLAHLIRYWDDSLKDGVAQLLSVIDPYYYFETTVLAETSNGNNNILLELLNYFQFVFPEVQRMDHFGWLKMRDGDPNFEGVFNAGNGVNRQFDILNWNYESNSHFFNEPCNKIQGSTGEIHSSSGNRDYIDIFIPDICRYVRTYFTEEVIVNGIVGHKFSGTKRSFDNGTIDPENACFCNGECIPSGLINATSCKYGLNTFFSLPHFYNADETYINAVEGISPNKSLHEAYIVIEPNTRICLEFRLRFQINAFTRNMQGLSDFETYPNLYFPLFWLEQEAPIQENIAKYVKIILNFPYYIIACGIVLTVVGSCLTGHAVYKIIEPYRLKNSCINNKALNVILESVPLNQNKNMC